MQQTLVILGRQPKIGLAELERLFGADKVIPINSSAALLNIEPDRFNIDLVGGCLKACRVLDILDTTDWRTISKILEARIPEHSRYISGKLTLGISAYGVDTNTKSIFNFSLSIKKLLKAQGKSVRIVPNKELILNSAQVLHNDLTSKNGWELCLVRHGSQTILAQTFGIQNIEKYSKRDQARPYRDAKVGMLPPKFAQTIVNLAVGSSKNLMVLDPFCGTGVVLQEAILLGHKAYGTDLEPRMIEYSQKNLRWLFGNINNVSLEVADAKSHSWSSFDAVAAETFLGKPLRGEPSENLLRKMSQEVNDLHVDFLNNIGKQVKPGTVLCLGVPAWRYKNGFLHLKIVDDFKHLGYTRMKLQHADWEDLIYWREGQQTAREIVLLKKD